MSSIEMMSILSKQWATASDIQQIANCGRDNAIIIRNNIISKIKKEGKNLPIAKKKIVPMESVIEYLSLNIDYIYSMAQKEKKFN